MRIVKESEQEFRFGDWGPKYLRRDRDWEGGVIVVAPGKKLEYHYHEEVEECFYVIQGKPTIVVNGLETTLEPTEAIIVSPREHHTIKNETPETAKVFFVKSPYLPKDRVTIEEAK